MCGIVGAVAQRDVAPVLLEGLRRLEYRGYDSAGMAILDLSASIGSQRVLGKVADLARRVQEQPMPGATGIAHTRWATHGKPSLINAHPHICREQVALVHNGIIENHNDLRKQQQGYGYQCNSETDSEVVVNQIHYYMEHGKDPLQAVAETAGLLQGAYALGVLFRDCPGRLIAARHGSPLVIGIGIGEYFIASDIYALLPVTREFIYLQEGDIVDLDLEQGVTIYDARMRKVERRVVTSDSSADAADKAGYRHYMQKEIFTQPAAVADTLEGRILAGKVIDEAFGMAAPELLDQTQEVHIAACGTSYHAGLVARYWLESMANIPCTVEIASEYRYRKTVVRPGTLFIAISQSGETADTLAALKLAGTRPYLGTLSICNVPDSSMTRESDLVFMTRAGIEIGVASTKAFTTQLTALMLFSVLLARRHAGGEFDEESMVDQIEGLPGKINQALELDAQIRSLAEQFAGKHHVLYLGRGNMLPIAMEGALKLKEISYIHAEAYAAGELKHGPLALVDENTPVIAVAPNNELMKKLESNLHEVRARGGRLYVFADSEIDIDTGDACKLTILPVGEMLAPIIYTMPLQLLAYHVAVQKGADVDQPRNLAKSVTVE